MGECGQVVVGMWWFKSGIGKELVGMRLWESGHNDQCTSNYFHRRHITNVPTANVHHTENVP